MSLADAEEEYLREVFDRADPSFLACEGAKEFLKSTTAMRVFVPNNWNGIQGIEPLKLEFKSDMPTRIKPPQRNVPRKIYDAAKKEFERMIQYFYEESTPPVASPVVFAPKSSAPWVRACGDYRIINMYVVSWHYPIPDVIKSIHKALGFVIFTDLDVRNAFHEILLHWEISRMLSVQTPWGQSQPKSLPEGVAPASGILLHIMYEIFSDFLEWTIVIFDNILVLGVDEKDCYEKKMKVINRCRERNVLLNSQSPNSE
jgi:hypothetical protein